jgi:hypothetical protein
MPVCENANRVKRNQVVKTSTKDDQQNNREACEIGDTDGKREAIAAMLESTWQEPVAGQERGQAWEIGEGSVRREYENQSRRDLQGDPKRPFAKNGASNLRQNTLFGWSRIHLPRQIGNAEEHRAENDAHCEEGPAGVFWFWRFEGRHPIGDRLGAGHRCTSLGES